MKFLRNPIVVGILVVVALALVFRNALAPMWQRYAPSFASSGVTASPASAPAASSATALTAKTNAPIATDINISLVETSAVVWMDFPRRDPFRPLSGVSGDVKSALEVLTLNAVWESVSNSFAVINNKVLASGDTILGFRVEKVDPDQVSVRGPQGVLEALKFKSDLSAANPAVANPSGNPINR